MLDSVIPIEWLRGVPESRGAISGAIEDGHVLMASVLTRTEVTGGMRSSERRATDGLISALDWVDVDEEISDLAGRYARKFRRSHNGIGVVDYVIAATADRLGAELWTRNVKHFPMFPDLVPPY